MRGVLFSDQPAHVSIGLLDFIFRGRNLYLCGKSFPRENPSHMAGVMNGTWRDALARDIGRGRRYLLKANMPRSTFLKRLSLALVAISRMMAE